MKVNNAEVKFEFDELRMYFGEDYRVNDYIAIHQPTIGEILEFGENRTYSSIMPFTSNATTYRLQLWDMGIDWNKISDFELFCMLIQSLSIEDTKLVFGDFDFSKLKPYKKVFKKDNEENSSENEEESEIVLVHDDNKDIEIDELTYLHIREYLRIVFDQHPKSEFAKGKTTKQAIIDEERMNLEMEERKNKGKMTKGKSFLLPLVSAMVNHPGFKYKTSELKECGIVEFMDSVKRLQVYESTKALMSGMYSGMLDTSKMNLNKELNWLRDLSE